MRIFNIKPYSIVLAFILLFALVLLFSSSPVSGDLQSAQGSGNTGMDGRSSALPQLKFKLKVVVGATVVSTILVLLPITLTVLLAQAKCS